MNNYELICQPLFTKIQPWETSHGPPWPPRRLRANATVGTYRQVGDVRITVEHRKSGIKKEWCNSGVTIQKWWMFQIEIPLLWFSLFEERKKTILFLASHLKLEAISFDGPKPKFGPTYGRKCQLGQTRSSGASSAALEVRVVGKILQWMRDPAPVDRW